MKRRVFLFPAAVFLGTACLLSGCGKNPPPAMQVRFFKEL